MKIKPCIHGGRVKWAEPWEPVEGFEYVFLECTRLRCDHGDWDCRSEYFLNNRKGREAAIIDWNRKVEKRKRKEKANEN